MKKITMVLAAICMISCVSGYEKQTAEAFEKTISGPDVQILDVRTAEEYAEGHIPGSVLIDVNSDTFLSDAVKRLDVNHPVAIYCRSGKRSAKACGILSDEGYTAINLEEGFEGWKKAGKPTTTNDMKTVCEFIKNCGHYFIATADGDQPRVRPFGTINIYDGKLYIQTGHKKRTAQQLAKNGKAELCAFDGKKWIRVSGTLVEDTRIEAKKSMLDAYPELRSMYDENDDNTAVYYFTNGVAYISSFTEPEETIRF